MAGLKWRDASGSQRRLWVASLLMIIGGVAVIVFCRTLGEDCDGSLELVGLALILGSLGPSWKSGFGRR